MPKPKTTVYGKNIHLDGTNHSRPIKITAEAAKALGGMLGRVRGLSLDGSNGFRVSGDIFVQNSIEVQREVAKTIGGAQFTGVFKL